MNKSRIHAKAGACALVVLAMLAAPGAAAPVKDALAGQWQVTVDYDGRKMASILSLSRSKQGQLGGRWISFWGASELNDVQQEENKLSFTMVSRFREPPSTRSFAGKVEGRTLSGTLSRDEGQSRVEGTRIRPVPRAVGQWDAKIKVEQREYSATLVVKAGAKNKLTAEWQSQWGEHEITDVAFKKDKLTFRRKSSAEDRQWESTFEGTIKGHVLSGTFTSERGNASLEANRVGAALVGTWELNITSDSGSRAQVLKVNPDLSGWFGPLAIDKIALEGNRVSFTKGLEFGDRKFDISFTGTLDGKKLTGELTSPRGSQTVEGVKKGRKEASKPPRKPDVVFVPTPHEVVKKMLELAQVKETDLVYDLGCGDGRIVVAAAKEYGCRGVGYDINPKRVKESLENVEKSGVGHLVRIEQEDIFTLDLSQANVITLYLLPKLNVKLIPQLEKLKPGSRIVSHDFAMRGVKPDKVVTVTLDDSWQEHTVYLWTTPLKKEN
ncbi:MAG: methyltransferase domain-containing protein [Sedimentisphaerales bacterium]|nr:methyltransferase domain-containing protein [Sedimentisphaerales bacterium]